MTPVSRITEGSRLLFGSWLKIASSLVCFRLAQDKGLDSLQCPGWALWAHLSRPGGLPTALLHQKSGDLGVPVALGKELLVLVNDLGTQ